MKFITHPKNQYSTKQIYSKRVKQSSKTDQIFYAGTLFAVLVVRWPCVGHTHVGLCCLPHALWRLGAWSTRPGQDTFAMLATELNCEGTGSRSTIASLCSPQSLIAMLGAPISATVVGKRSGLYRPAGVRVKGPGKHKKCWLVLWPGQVL